MSDALRDAVGRYAAGSPTYYLATPIPGVGIGRAPSPTGIQRTLYKPLACLILQGAKQVTVGLATHEFAAGQTAIVRADVPASSRIIRASPAEPYLALAVDLDLGVLAELAAQLDPPAAGSGDPPVLVAATQAAVADCALRLMRLLDRPDAIPVLSASLLRELHYWLLTGPQGSVLRALGRPNGVGQRIARAVAILRAEFDRPVRVERLAAAAGMSPSSFHQHFRAVTSLSPIQFQKRLRLIEARRLMLGEGLSASRAAFRVGYESVSQFTREYGRTFGCPPARDVRVARDPRAARAA